MILISPVRCLPAQPTSSDAAYLLQTGPRTLLSKLQRNLLTRWVNGWTNWVRLLSGRSGKLAIYISVRHKQSQQRDVQIDVLVRVRSVIVFIQGGIIPVGRQLSCQYHVGERELVIRRIFNMPWHCISVVPVRDFRLTFLRLLDLFAAGLLLSGWPRTISFRMNVLAKLRFLDSLEPPSQPFIFFLEGIMGTRLA